MNNQYVTPTKVHGFRFWCQKVIPLVFDDSLSYYEVLCKLTHFMNEFSESLNMTIDGLLELQEYFEEFKEDINKTLDEIKKLAYTLDGIYRLDLNANYLNTGLTNKEKEDLKDILNDMIKKEVVKPIVLDVKNNENMTVYSNIIYTDNDFINNIKNDNNIIIDFNAYYQYRGSMNRLDLLIFEVTEYTIVDGLIDTIISVDANYNTSSFLPLDGSVSFTPTLENQPATKGYVDSHAGGGSSTDITLGNYTLFNSNNLSTNTTDWENYLQDCYDNNKPISIISFNDGYGNARGIIVGGSDTIDLQTKPSEIVLNYMYIYPDGSTPKISTGEINIQLTWNDDDITVTYVNLTQNYVDLYSKDYIDQNLGDSGYPSFDYDNLLYNPTTQTEFMALLNDMLTGVKPVSPILIIDSSKQAYLTIPTNFNDLINGGTTTGFYLNLSGCALRKFNSVIKYYYLDVVVDYQAPYITNINSISLVDGDTEFLQKDNFASELGQYVKVNDYRSSGQSSMQNGLVIDIDLSNLEYMTIPSGWDIISVIPYFIDSNDLTWISIPESDYTWSTEVNSTYPDGRFHFNLATSTSRSVDTAYLNLRITAVKDRGTVYGPSWLLW